MKYATIKEFDTSNGPGIRLSIYLQGCPHKCKNCFNPETWDVNGGIEIDKDEFIQLLKGKLDKGKGQYTGISILGGEPMMPENNIEITQAIMLGLKEYSLPFWVWTGYTLDEILNIVDGLTGSSEDSRFPDETYLYVLENIEMLIDGKFDESKKDLSLKYSGSTNQNEIDSAKIIKTMYERWV